MAIACQALIMPGAVRRPQHVFTGGRSHSAVRITSFSPQRLHRGSPDVVAAQNRQPDATTPHQITGLGARAARATHSPPDHHQIVEAADSTSSIVDLFSRWRRLADGAAALAVIMALMLAPLSGSAWAARSGGRMGGSSFSSARSSGRSSSRSYGGSSSRSSYGGGSSRSSYGGRSSRSSYGGGGSSSARSSGGSRRTGSSSRGTGSSSASSTPGRSFASSLGRSSPGRSSPSSGSSSSSSTSITIAPQTSYHSSAPWVGSGPRPAEPTAAEAFVPYDDTLTDAEAEAVDSLALAFLIVYMLFVFSTLGGFW